MQSGSIKYVLLGLVLAYGAYVMTRGGEQAEEEFDATTVGEEGTKSVKVRVVPIVCLWFRPAHPSLLRVLL